MRSAWLAAIIVFAVTACTGTDSASTDTSTPLATATVPPSTGTPVTVLPSTSGPTTAPVPDPAGLPEPPETPPVSAALEDEWFAIIEELIAIQASVGQEPSLDIADRLCAPDSACHDETLGTLTYLVENGLRIEGGPEPDPPDQVELLGSPDDAPPDEALTMLLWVTRTIDASPPGRLVDAEGNVVQEVGRSDGPGPGDSYRQLWTMARVDLASPWRIVEFQTVD